MCILGFFFVFASSFNRTSHSFINGLTVSLNFQHFWRAIIKNEVLPQALFLGRKYYLELGSCSKPVTKTTKESRCITVTGKTVLFNIAHTMRVSKKRYCTLKYTNL